MKLSYVVEAEMSRRNFLKLAGGAAASAAMPSVAAKALAPSAATAVPAAASMYKLVPLSSAADILKFTGIAGTLNVPNKQDPKRYTTPGYKEASVFNAEQELKMGPVYGIFKKGEPYIVASEVGVRNMEGFHFKFYSPALRHFLSGQLKADNIKGGLAKTINKMIERSIKSEKRKTEYEVEQEEKAKQKAQKPQHDVERKREFGEPDQWKSQSSEFESSVQRRKLIEEVKQPIKVGDMVHSATKYFVQWSVGPQGKRIPIQPFWMKQNSMGKILDLRFDKGRPDIDTEDLYTVTLQFLYGGLDKKGSIGMANGPTLESLIKRY